MNREVNPLTIAEDATVVDTTEMNIEEVVEYVKSLIDGKECEE